MNKKKYNVCLDIGGTKVLGAVFNSKDKIICRVKKRSNEKGNSSENLEDVIISVTEELLAKANLKHAEINAISAGVPGIIDCKTGVVKVSPNLPWKDYNLRKVIEKKFKTKFYIGNDVNVGVLGEYRYGACKGYKNVVGFFIGTGIGGGLILNKKLFLGTGFKAGEYGHMILDPNGPKCNCGQNGCLEAYSSKTGMAKYMKELVKNGEKSFMEQYLDDAPFKSKYLKQALELNDEVAIKACDRSCHYLAIGAGSLINTIAPDCVVFGGGVMESCGDYFMEHILKEIDCYCMKAIRETVDIKRAALGDDSNLYGALAMIHDAEK